VSSVEIQKIIDTLYYAVGVANICPTF